MSWVIKKRDAEGKFFRDAKLLIRAPHPIAGIIKGMVAAGLVVEGVGVFGIKPSAGASGLPVAVGWLWVQLQGSHPW